MKGERDPSDDDLTDPPRPADLQGRHRSFIDMRGFASQASLGSASRDLHGDDRFLASRRFLDLPPGPISAGAITLAQGSGTVSLQPADEFVVVADGTISFTQGGQTLTLRPGESAVLRQGAAYSWAAPGPVSIPFMRYQGSDGAGAGPAIVPIDRAPQLAPSGAPLAELLLTPTPRCRNQTDYRSADGQFSCGTWDSTPYHRAAMLYHHYELMHLLEGSVTFVDASGRRASFHRGDIFLVEQGASCSWESLEPVAKVYAIFRPT
ncbi:hypothetical protein B7760_04204 [Burkholderia glumae]|uniref:cupin domain-containing protein n=1 Tax=Burkholderia glumae TaxID=337 RepID=UPI001373FE4E|nr:cupin domain-containing protein [Burkholderia glumae]MCR1769558.1 DUF861 domain-containing protein [Burkholderia glumae]QHP92632.1 DUF861 domain-containing protein [Burkholderia glumae]QKM50143.1 hypothetical protein B7760_04204 [Burkholderia glumae]